MCVPQGNKTTLSSELLQAKGDEVGKQMHVLSFNAPSSSIRRLIFGAIGRSTKEPKRVLCGFIAHTGSKALH